MESMKEIKLLSLMTSPSQSELCNRRDEEEGQRADVRVLIPTSEIFHTWGDVLSPCREWTEEHFPSASCRNRLADRSDAGNMTGSSVRTSSPIM